MKAGKDLLTMQPVPFDSSTDLPPIPFDVATCSLARQLKDSGLPWKPHVGCFVWDPDRRIRPVSPFPNHIYFILSLPRFLDIFGSLSEMQDQLVWLPTWHQTRLLCRQYSIEPADAGIADSPAEALKTLYRQLLDALAHG